MSNQQTSSFIYGFNKLQKIFFTSFLIISFAGLVYCLIGKDLKGIWLGILAVISAICAWLVIFNLHINIKDKGILSGVSFFSDRLKKYFPFDEVTIINEDSFLFLHSFHIVGNTNFKRLFIYNGIKNYRQLLKDVILRVRPETSVDDKSLQYANLKREDIGKLYKKDTNP